MRSRLLHALLRVYPEPFRSRHADELLAYWTAQAGEARYRGAIGRARFAVQVTLDAVRVGSRMRMDERRTGEGGMGMIGSDVRYAVRALRASPLFAVVAALTIALGIGATTSVFTIVNAVVLRPLPYPEPDRLVRILRYPTDDRPIEVAWPDFRDWREQAEGFSGMSAYMEGDGAVEWESGAEFLKGARVTRDFFGLMGVGLAVGRTFSEEEDRLGGPDAIVISHGMWVSRFGSDPGVLGRTVPFEGADLPIVGVAAPGFSAPYEGTRYWLPMQDDELLTRIGLSTGGRSTTFQSVIGRLAPGVDGAVAEAGLRALARRIDESVGKHDGDLSEVTLVPYGDSLVEDVRGTLFFLLTAAALVLVVAAANVAGLALSRAVVRERELAVRRALGAVRGRLLRQLLAEAFVLCGVAGAAGLGIAWFLEGALVRLAPEGLPRVEEVGVTPATVGFALLATLVSALVIGLPPAWRSTRAERFDRLRDGRGSSDRSALGPQQVLASFQVAVAVLLLTGAGLLTSSFVRLLRVERGFDAESVVVATVAPSDTRYATSEEVSAFYATLLERVRALPGVQHASTTYSPPLFENGFSMSIAPEGAPEDAESIEAATIVIGDDWFEASGTPLLQGRPFGPDDASGGPLVVIVSRSLARMLWPDEDPLGKRIEFAGTMRGSFQSSESFERGLFPEMPMTVVGVAGDVRRSSLAEPPAPEYYRPHRQLTFGFQYLVVRVAGDPDDLAESLRATVWDVDATVPVRDVVTLADQVGRSVAADRFRMLLVGAFAALTCLLAVLGLYSIMALAVARRTREMGIRVALGASRADVVRGVLDRGLRLVGAGTVLGLVTAWLAGRAVSAMLFEVRPTDLPTYLLVSTLVAAVGAAASYGPARRAGRVDPMISLRSE